MVFPDVVEAAQRHLPRFLHRENPPAYEAPSPDHFVARYAFPLDLSTNGYGLTPEKIKDPNAVEQLLTDIGEYRANPICTSEVKVVADKDIGNTVRVTIRWDQGITKGEVTYAVARLSSLDEKRL